MKCHNSVTSCSYVSIDYPFNEINKRRIQQTSKKVSQIWTNSVCSLHPVFETMKTFFKHVLFRPLFSLAFTNTVVYHLMKNIQLYKAFIRPLKTINNRLLLE